MTRQPIWVILFCPPEEGEEKRDSRGDKRKEQGRMKVKKQKK